MGGGEESEPYCVGKIPDAQYTTNSSRLISRPGSSHAVIISYVINALASSAATQQYSWSHCSSSIHSLRKLFTHASRSSGSGGGCQLRWVGAGMHRNGRP